MFAYKRLGKELVKIKQSLPPGITLVSADDFKEWQMDIQVLDNNPIYLNQTYRLRFRFNNNYPIEPPEVVFLRILPTSRTPLTPSHPPSSPSPLPTHAPGTLNHPIPLDPSPPPTSPTPPPLSRPIPIHPHIYSNGIICLDLLGTAGWSPVQNVESVCMSIQSMLTGNTKNERPEGDEAFVRSNTQRPRDISFVYHDDGC